jgi:serine phosphatase RsbU (regulator of sigma subunit)
MKKLPVLFPVLFFFNGLCQNREIDSIEARLKAATDISEIVYEKASLVPRYYSAGRAKESLDLMDEAITTAQRGVSDKALGALHNSRGILHFYTGAMDSALVHFEKSIQHRKKANDMIGALKSTGNVGNIYLSRGQYEKAQGFYEEALKMEAALGIEEGKYASLNNLAAIYSNLNMNRKAIRYYTRSVSLSKKDNNYSNLSTAYDGLATVYREMDKYDSAFYFARSSMKLCAEAGDRNGYAYALHSLAITHHWKKNYDSAIIYLRQALPLVQASADARLMIGILGNLIGNFVMKGQKDSAMVYMQSLMPLYEQLNIRNLDPDMLKLSAEFYFLKGDLPRAYEKMKLYAMVADSVYRMQMSAKAAELQEKYETDKKEKENRLLQSENERHKATRNLLIVILVLALLSVIGAVIAIRRIRKAKMMISSQKALVEEKQKEIMDSINYARRIQYALLASDQLLKKHLPQHFVFFKPKAVVSGDFYWASSTNDGFAVVTGDCTGHGVPGAFMSLLNITKLSQVINELKITRPDLVFNKVRDEIVKVLNPEGAAEAAAKDGMDAVLCKFRSDKPALEYAAANNSIYVVRNKQLIVCKADKMPVGKGNDDNQSFTYNEIHLEKEDMVYMFTDGFADQFGGPLGKKFKYKQFEQLLVSISHEEMGKQRAALENTFERWRGSLEQIDDVCVVGVRV